VLKGGGGVIIIIKMDCVDPALEVKITNHAANRVHAAIVINSQAQ
jgi:hypothetical protein